jgi:hypothetical protein
MKWEEVENVETKVWRKPRIMNVDNFSRCCGVSFFLELGLKEKNEFPIEYGTTLGYIS